MGKRKKHDDTFLLKKKKEKNQNSVNNFISVDGKGAVFPVNYLNKDI